ncbi:MAG: IMS domain-containing protein [Thermosynechococcaceae cyanobacterium]
MRIPLDLYQILGVPIQATSEQLQQAFADRRQQLPRQQYSKTAIQSRNQLLEQAYAVLSNEELKAAYDRNILAEIGLSDGAVSSGAPAVASGMELEEEQLVGALLLLQDLGEYDTILELGEAYLNRSIDLNQLPAQTTPVAEEDVVLTMALAYLEAGREQWQQQQFEQTAESLVKGRDLLIREQCFPELQEEIQTDLDMLRPYQILERLSLPQDDPERQQGLSLLQDMLDQRGGIDGRQEDQSGLGIDDFLRFVQQLRSHLTVAEQQTLFEKEAQRPSAVASYLASYALVAGGFSEGKPQDIQQAQARLSHLATRQDTYVEQAMCSLLLGHPNIATQILPLSQDDESLTFIRQYSEGSEDEIPGLFLYTEHWLQQEVYPYFRNLVDQPVSLQDYFNDKKIQAALCALEPITETVSRTTIPVKLPRAEPVSSSTRSIEEELQSLQAVNIRALQPEPLEERGAAAPERTVPQAAFASGPNSGIFANTHDRGGDPTAAPPAVRQGGPVRPLRRPRKQKGAQKGWLPLAGALLLGLVALGGLAALIWRPNKPSLVQKAPDDVPAIGQAGDPPLETPAPSSTSAPSSDPVALPAATAGQLSADDARQIIDSWQTIKAQAKGKSHEIDKLKQILVEPMLSDWTEKAQNEKARSAYWEYKLDTLTVDKVEPQGDSAASIFVEIKESGKILADGEVEYSYQDPYKARYDVVRQGDQWRIKNAKVLD